jgi:hypothetical protein
MVFCFVQNFFFGQCKSQNIIFFVAQSANVFFQNLTLGYMTKTLNQIIFFPPPKSEYFFQQHWESEYFLEKTHAPCVLTCTVVVFCNKKELFLK